MDEDKVVNGFSLKAWQATFRAGMPEFAATRFFFTMESKDLIRIAFGNEGPVINENGHREPVYTHAVTLPPDVAVNLAGMILKFYGQPASKPSKTSSEL